MSLITFKCKVKLFTEEEIELLDRDLDLPEVKGSWLVRDRVFRSEEIYQITRHSSGKTLLTTYSEENILIMEPFSVVSSKWKDAERLIEIIDDLSENQSELNSEEET